MGQSLIFPPGKLPTAQRESLGDVLIKVIEQSPPKLQQMERGGPMIATPWQQYRAGENRPLTVAFCYVVVLYSRQSKEAWICDITSASPNTLVVVSSLSRLTIVWYLIQTLRSVISSPKRSSAKLRTVIDTRGISVI